MAKKHDKKPNIRLPRKAHSYSYYLARELRGLTDRWSGGNNPGPLPSTKQQIDHNEKLYGFFYQVEPHGTYVEEKQFDLDAWPSYPNKRHGRKYLVDLMNAGKSVPIISPRRTGLTAAIVAQGEQEHRMDLEIALEELRSNPPDASGYRLTDAHGGRGVVTSVDPDEPGDDK